MDQINYTECEYEGEKPGNNQDIDDKSILVNRYLEEVVERSKELERQKDTFIDIAAHELKTPITSIRGFAQLLEEDASGDIEKRVHYIHMINHNTDRLYQLILNMVDAFKIMNNDLKLNVEAVNIYDIFENSRNRMEKAIANTGITPRFYIQENLPIIKTDVEKLFKTINNLILNSISFTENGSISLNIYADGPEHIHFEVKDTGKGIPVQDQQFIFSTFYQADGSLSRKTGGVGLGLFISRGLVEKMNGKIWFESEVGKGSTFHFIIPVSYQAKEGQD